MLSAEAIAVTDYNARQLARAVLIAILFIFVIVDLLIIAMPISI